MALTALACLYVVMQLWNSGALGLAASRPALLWVLPLCAVLALAANGCLALAWVYMCLRLNPEDFSLRRAFMVYAFTQFGKYLPGNVFHFAGRYGMGLGLGLTHGVLGLTTLLEPLFLVFVAGLISLPFMGEWLWGWVAAHATLALWIGGIVGIVAVAVPAAAYFLLRGHAWLIQNILELIRPSIDFFKGKALVAMALYVMFLALNGLGAWLLLSALSDTAWPAGSVLSANAFAWVLGYVTIGSPAGLGIREAAMIFALGGQAQGAVVAMVALHRLASLAGDFIFFGIGAAGLKYAKDQSA